MLLLERWLWCGERRWLLGVAVRNLLDETASGREKVKHYILYSTYCLANSDIHTATGSSGALSIGSCRNGKGLSHLDTKDMNDDLFPMGQE